MEFFNFEPDEYQVLEDIEFDETIQRPEKVRFYTLEDQLVDATERLIPRDKRYTRYDLEQIKYEVSRYEELYRKYIQFGDEEYTVVQPESSQDLNWIFPAIGFTDSAPYIPRINFREDYNRVFEAPRAPGYYPRLLASLPRRRVDVPGTPYPIETPQVFMDTDVENKLSYRVLPASMIVRTQRHTDQNYSILEVPVEGTEDVLNIAGYRIAERPVDIPNPNPDHPFFKENKDTFIDSTAPLSDVIPSMNVIFEHGIPVTRDPYGEGMKYLKVYDVRMENIPWALWRTRFPPEEPITKMPQIEPLKFPKPAQNAPSEKILKAYNAPYFPGISARYWLMQRPDGGELIVRALLADSFTNGSVAIVPGLDLGQPRYPDTTLDQCILTGKIFEEFQTTGIIRRIPGKKDEPDTYVCVPPEFVLQERRQLGYTGRTAFKESAPAEILKQHVDALARYGVTEKVEKEKVEPKTPAQATSEKRTEILAILDDERREVVDKLKDIREVLKDTILEKRIHSDSTGLFVICTHTLAILEGNLEKDRRSFYEEWSAEEEGFRVCKFCGQHIVREDAVDQIEYDDAGRPIKKAGAMEETVFKSETLASYITGIRAIQPLFDLDNPMENIMYTLLTILHVLPVEAETKQILGIGRALATNMFKKADAGTELGKIQRGVLGIAMTVVLLQTHIPFLIPRRSFGSRPLKLDGYPRDGSKKEGPTIIDSMIRVLTTTYDAFPTAVKGPSAPIIRAVLRTASKMKGAVEQFLEGKVLKEAAVRELFGRAITKYAEAPPPTQELQPLIEGVVPSMKLGVIEHGGECRSTQVVLASSRQPQIQQEEPRLRDGIMPSAGAKIVLPTKSRRTKTAPMPTEEIIARRSLGSGAVRYEIKDGWRTNLMIAARLADLFNMETNIASVDPRQGADELRDIAKGYVFEALREIQTTPVKRKRFEQLRNTDIVLLMLSAEIDIELAAVNRTLAKQRSTFVTRMAERSDLEREIIEDLKRRGIAPFIITTGDRELFASEIEEQIRPKQSFEEEEELAVPQDEGVGLPQAPEGSEEEAPGRILDRGDYGDMAPLPAGRDPLAASLADDAATSV
jgi:hypothetical protein